MNLIIALKVVQDDWQTRPSVALLIITATLLGRLQYLAGDPFMKGIAEARESRGADGWCGVSDVITESNFLCVTRDGLIYLDARAKHSGMVLDTRPVSLATIATAFERAQHAGTIWAAFDDETREAALNDVTCRRVEYDLSFDGVKYSSHHVCVSHHVCIPDACVETFGSVEAAFAEITGIDPCHIVNIDLNTDYTLDARVLASEPA